MLIWLAPDSGIHGFYLLLYFYLSFFIFCFQLCLEVLFITIRSATLAQLYSLKTFSLCILHKCYKQRLISLSGELKCQFEHSSKSLGKFAFTQWITGGVLYLISIICHVFVKKKESVTEDVRTPISRCVFGCALPVACGLPPQPRDYISRAAGRSRDSAGGTRDTAGTLDFWKVCVAENLGNRVCDHRQSWHDPSPL